MTKLSTLFFVSASAIAVLAAPRPSFDAGADEMSSQSRRNADDDLFYKRTYGDDLEEREPFLPLLFGAFRALSMVHKVHSAHEAIHKRKEEGSMPRDLEDLESISERDYEDLEDLD